MLMSRAKRRIRGDREASTLVPALVMIAVVAFIACNLLESLSARHQTSYASASWQDALNAAEGGADLAMTALNGTVSSGTLNWPLTTGSFAISGTFAQSGTNWSCSYSGLILTHTAGEGNSNLYVNVTMTPISTGTSNPTYYQIVSTGIAGVPGGSRASAGEETSMLNISGVKNHRSIARKLNFI